MTDESENGDVPATDGGRFERRSVLKAMGAGTALAAVPGTALGLESGTDSSGVTPAELSAARTRTTTNQRKAIAAKTECSRNDQREIFGPTDINAQSANGRLAVGVNGEGTMTVFRWPRPSFYEQLKYYTLGRDENDEILVPPNEGAFLGVRAAEGGTAWLRDWGTVEQRYANDIGETETGGEYSDEVVTTYTDPPSDSGIPSDLKVTVRDVVPPDEDAFVRHVEAVQPGRSGGDDAPDLELVAFENYNLVNSKHVQFPIHDWCTEENNQDRARYVQRHDAIAHTLKGVDESTGEQQNIAVAMGFASDSTAHQVGGDAHEPAAEPTGEAGPTRDAYDAASEGSFPGNDEYAGQTTGALVTDLAFEGDGNAAAATETVVFAADHSLSEAATVLGEIRNRDFDELRAAKETWLADELADALLPDVPARSEVDDEAVLNLCRRALVTLITTYDRHRDPETGAIVASIATQAPYGEDWVRDGAFFNYVLSLIGQHEKVETHDRWYAEIQQRADDPRPSHPNTPPGNWAMVYYADGVAGGPIPYEIDETGYGVWTMWDHYDVTGDEDYLRAVYPAIKRAADFMVRCRNPETGLHCRASWEDDNYFNFTPSIVGASIVWLGLKAAKQAAEVLGHDQDRQRFADRQHEIGRAIDRELYDTENGAYGLKDGERYAMGEVTWPVCFTPYYDTSDDEIRDRPVVDNPLEHPRIRSHLDIGWKSVKNDFKTPDLGNDDVPDTGQYEVKQLIPLAKARRGSEPGSLDQVKDGIDWIATEHATPDTHIMGEAWKVFDGGPDDDPEVRSIVSQPHVWEQVMTYLAALEVWPPEEVEFDERTCGSVTQAIRELNAPD